MSSLDFTSSIAFQLFQLFLRRNRWTVSELLLELKYAVTIQAVYKQLRVFETRQMVVRHSGHYSLSLTWIVNAQQTLGRAFEDKLSPRELDAYLPEKNEVKKWHFGDLLVFDRLLVQLLLATLERSHDRMLYQWMPIPWFVLVADELTRAYGKTMKARGNRAYVAVANDTILSTQFRKLVPSTHFSIEVHAKPRRMRCDHFVSVVPPYVITARYDMKTIEALRQVSQVLDVTKAAAALFQSALRFKAKLTISIEHNERKSTVICAAIKQLSPMP
jgi:hypothetical protein